MKQTIVTVTEVKFVSNPKIVLSNKNWKKVRQYMKIGYQICDRPEGEIILEKKPEVIITFISAGEVKNIGFSNRLSEFYGRELHTKELYEMFNEDLKNNSVTVNKGKDGYYVATSQKEDE